MWFIVSMTLLMGELILMVWISACLLYADDLVIFSKNGYCLSKLLNVFDTYCDDNSLTVNNDKCKVIVFRKGGYLARHERWFLGRKLLHSVNFYSYLGLGFTPKCVWSSAQANLSASALKALFSLKKMFAKTIHLPVSQFLQIFDIKIMPILTYMADLWDGSPQKSTKCNELKFLLIRNIFLAPILNKRKKTT